MCGMHEMKIDLDCPGLSNFHRVLLFPLWEDMVMYKLLSLSWRKNRKRKKEEKTPPTAHPIPSHPVPHETGPYRCNAVV